MPPIGAPGLVINPASQPNAPHPQVKPNDVSGSIQPHSAGLMSSVQAPSGHSFTPLVATSGLLLSLLEMKGIRHVDTERQRVHLSAKHRMCAR